MASHQIYNSAPLDLDAQCIRLVEILPRSEAPETFLKFHTYQLVGRPEYYALSYNWGHTTNQRQIFVNDTKFSIRENLWSFLQQQTYLKAHDLIWIDALCIDQGNMHERNHQVTMMAATFSLVRAYAVFGNLHTNCFRQSTSLSGSGQPPMIVTTP